MENQSANLCMPQSSWLQKMVLTVLSKGFDAQVKTAVKAKLLNVTSWLSLLNAFTFRAIAAVPNIWKNDQNVVENAFLA